LKTMDSRKSAVSLAILLACLLIGVTLLPQQETSAQQLSPVPTATWTPYVVYVTATPTPQQTDPAALGRTEAISTATLQRTAGSMQTPPAMTQALATDSTAMPEPPAVMTATADAPALSATPVLSYPVRITLTDLGYDSGATASGVRARSSIYFPLPSAGISGGMLTLHLRVSPLLHPRSSIRIDVNDKPAVTFFVEDISPETTLTIPLEPTQGTSVRVNLAGQLFVGEDLCFDQDSPSLWFSLREDSELAYTPVSTELATIRDFLSQQIGTIWVHGLWDTPEHQASSIALFSVLKFIYRGTESQVSLSTEPGATVLPCDKHNLPTSTVWVVDDPDAPPVNLQGNSLYVTTDPKTLLALLAQAGETLQLGQEVTKLKRVPAIPVFPRDDLGLSDYRLYLSDMGIGNQERQGFSGEFSVYLRFTPADFGGWPADLRFSLDSAFDPVPTDTLERAFLRIRLNSRLLESADIRGRAALRTQVIVPSAALAAENYLQISLAYAPEAGSCYGAPWAFTGQVLDSSYFTWSRYDTSPNIFPALVGEIGGEGLLFLFDSSAATAQAVAQLIGNLSLYTARPVIPVLADSAVVAKETNDASYRIVVGGNRETLHSFGLPLSIDGEVEVIDPTTNTTILAGSSDQPLVVAQYVSNAGPVLGFQAEPALDPQALLDAVSRMTAPEVFFDLGGNVVVGTADETISFDPNLSELQIRSRTPIETEPTWLDTQQDRLERNRLPLALLLIAFVLALSLLIARRMGRRLPPPIPPED